MIECACPATTPTGRPSHGAHAMRRRLVPAALFAAGLATLALRAAAADPAPAPVFEKDVLPLFRAKCLRCHGADKRQAELDLRGKPTMLKGGESGPVLSPGSPEKS